MSKHRFVLTRTINPDISSRVAFIGVNPSTAGPNTDDHTTTKLIEFTKRWGFGKYRLVNIYPYRATNIEDLENYGMRADMQGENRRVLTSTCASVDLIVPMWGRRSKIPKHLQSEVDWVEKVLQRYPVPVKVFDWTQDGNPKHPLMLPYTTELRDFFHA